MWFLCLLRDVRLTRCCRYSVRYRAVFLPTAAGLHTMSVTHRETVKLWVDGVHIIDSSSSGGTSVTVSATINLPQTNTYEQRAVRL